MFWRPGPGDCGCERECPARSVKIRCDPPACSFPNHICTGTIWVTPRVSHSPHLNLWLPAQNNTSLHPTRLFTKCHAISFHIYTLLSYHFICHTLPGYLQIQVISFHWLCHTQNRFSITIYTFQAQNLDYWVSDKGHQKKWIHSLQYDSGGQPNIGPTLALTGEHRPCAGLPLTATFEPVQYQLLNTALFVNFACRKAIKT